jgi:hypothetical protein
MTNLIKRNSALAAARNSGGWHGLATAMLDVQARMLRA